MKQFLFIVYLVLSTMTLAHAGPEYCFIKVWQGTIGKAPVMMEFKQDQNNSELIVGKYYYRTSMDNLILRPDTKIKHQWKEFDTKNKLTGLLTLICTGNTLSGEWKSSTGIKALPIAAKKIADVVNDKIYAVPRLSAIKPRVINHGSLGKHQYEIIGIPNFNNGNTVVEGLRLSGNTAGIEKINNTLLKGFLSAIENAISCNTNARFENIKIEDIPKFIYSSESWSVISWHDNLVSIKDEGVNYCSTSTPHQDIWSSVRTYDLSTGEEEDARKWLTEYIDLDSPLGKILVQAYREQRDDNQDTDVCLQGLNIDTAVWPTDKGLAFPTSASYATSGCADPIVISYKSIWPYLSPKGQEKLRFIKDIEQR